jgi:tetratricopeptide (TPR) repeat protein
MGVSDSSLERILTEEAYPMTPDRMIVVAKQIIREGAKMGLDAAGPLVCGPAWPFVKKILTPVVEELQKQYPKLFLLDDKEAAATAEKAANALATNPALQKMLEDGMESLQEGQQEILDLLARYDNILRDLAESVDRGFQEAQQLQKDNYASVMAEVRRLGGRLAQPAAMPTATMVLSPEEADRRGNALQADAMNWIAAGDPDAASERLAQGRGVLLASLQGAPDDPRLLASLGYIEKSQAQVEFLKRHQETAVMRLSDAAKYFTRALNADPNEVSALNGIANIYYFAGDYDRAINIGRLVVEKEPGYLAGLFDFSLALDAKMNAVGPRTDLLQVLKAVYEMLLQVMPLEPQRFSAEHVQYVQRKLAEVDKLTAESNPAA